MNKAAALEKPSNDKKWLSDLIDQADREAKWLRFADGVAVDVKMPPERARMMLDGIYCQRHQWQIVSPLDLIAEKAGVLQAAREDFDRVREAVTEWFRLRREIDVAADHKNHPSPFAEETHR